MVRAIRRLFLVSILISSLTSSGGCGLTKNPDSAGPEDGGEKIVGPCGHLASHYRVTPAAACESTPFVCPDDRGAFFDTCGCGCTWTGTDSQILLPVPPSNAVRGPGEPNECGGAAGPFARFATATKRVVVGEDAVYVWVDPKSSYAFPDAGPDDVLWRVDKKSRGLTVILDSSRVVTETALVNVETRTSGPQSNDGYSYSRKPLDGNHTWLYRTPIAGGPQEVLFEFPDTPWDSWFIVVGDDFYATTAGGSLWHASALPGGAAPTLIEQRGTYDDDDYNPFFGADRDAVYWQAGVDPDAYTSDDATLTLFRKCRTSP